MKNRNLKQILSLTLSMLILLGVGCSNSVGDPSMENENTVSQQGIGQEIQSSAIKDNGAMGNYVEQDIPLPKEMKNVVGIYLGLDDTVQLLGSDETGNRLYSLEGDEWVQNTKSTWINLLKDGNILDVKAGEDRSVYLLVSEEGGYVGYHIANSGEINRSFLPREVVEEEGSGLSGVELLDSGDLLVTYVDGVVQYKSETLEVGYTYENVRSVPYVMGNSFVVYQKEGAIDCYDWTSGEKTQSIPFMGYHKNDGLQVKDGNTYVCNETGIYRRVEGGSIWERLVNGESMALTTGEIDDFVVGSEEDFYCMDRGSNLIKHYEYKEEEPVQMDEFVIYSMRPNYLIEETVGNLRGEYPDVRIIYQQVKPWNDATISKEDAIRILNTEILAGKGPDLLVLDELPIEDYIDKGVLMDLSHLVEADRKQGVYVEPVISTYEREGTLPAIPAAFQVPMMIADRETMEKSQTLEDLTEQVIALREEDSTIPAFSFMDKRFLLKTFYLTCAPTWGIEQGEIDEIKIAEYLEDIKTILESWEGEQDIRHDYEALPLSTEIPYYIYGIEGRMRRINLSLDNSLQRDMSILCSIATQYEDITYKKLVGQDETMKIYEPSTILGINNNTKHKEMAEEIIQYLIGETFMEVQNREIPYHWEGYPTNKNRIEKLITNIQEGERVGAFGDITGKQITTYYWPSYKEAQAYMDFVIDVNTPSTVDLMIFNMILDESQMFFENKETSEEAAHKIKAKIALYLAQ